MLMTTSILLPILLYMMPTVTNNKEMNMYSTMMENEITTTTVMYNQMMGTMTMLVLYMPLTLIVVVNIINVSKEPL